MTDVAHPSDVVPRATRRIITALAFIAALAAGRGGAADVCVGDCDGDGVVVVAELIVGVNIAFGNAAVTQCAACDRDANGVVTVDELIAAVRSALDGCPVRATPTALATPTPTAVGCEVPGVICTVAGTGNAQFDGDGRNALQTSLYFPIQVEFDRDGRPLILDWNNLRLRRIGADGVVETIMGTGDEALPVEGGLPLETPLHHASDVKFDPEGRLYVAGDHVSVVFRVDLDGRVYTVAGNCPSHPDDCYGYAGDGGPALEAMLSTPVGVLPDDAGGFYISDVDTDAIRYVDARGIIETVAGTGVQGYAGDGGAAREAQLADPRRMTFGPDGALYFAESKNHVIRRIHRDGTIDTVAGTGARGYAGDGGPAAQARLDSPYDVVFAAGSAYIADTNNNVIRRVDPSGTITTVVGTGEPRFSGEGMPALAAALRRPSGIIFDSAGSLWISDTSNNRVRRVWPPVS